MRRSNGEGSTSEETIAENGNNLLPHPEAFASGGKGPCLDQVHYSFGD